MSFLVDTYECEWKQVVDDPERRATFEQFVNAPGFKEDGIEFIEERNQRRPADWPGLGGDGTLPGACSSRPPLTHRASFSPLESEAPQYLRRRRRTRGPDRLAARERGCRLADQHADILGERGTGVKVPARRWRCNQARQFPGKQGWPAQRVAGPLTLPITPPVQIAVFNISGEWYATQVGASLGARAWTVAVSCRALAF